MKSKFRINMRISFPIVMLGAMLAGAVFSASAVTESEMDKAKAIAAKYYIRYVNNASGYLDNVSPASMSELESKLANDKDKESFKQFKNAVSAVDYASWDKDKLTEYWSVTFFSNNAGRLDSKGANNGEAKLKIKKAISAMSVAAPETPAPAPATQEETPAPQEEETQEVDLTNGIDPLAGMTIEQEKEEALLNEMDSLQDTMAAMEEMPAEEQSSGTWVYIMVLCILVVVVIGLVVYAARTMKGQQKKNREYDDDIPPRDTSYQGAETGYTRSVVEDTRMREKYAENLAAKSEEIRSLTRQLSDMELLAADLKEENRRLKAELEKLRNREMQTRPATPTQRPQASSAHTSAGTGSVYEVFLGRVNARGIFVRADRHLVDGQSIYKLTTTNGISGTFSVIENPMLDEMLMSDPDKWLAGGCVAKDLYDTAGRYAVLTETPGTAVFKDGAWRVERKARIRYE